jgi:hypothetical protein
MPDPSFLSSDVEHPLRKGQGIENVWENFLSNTGRTFGVLPA